MRVQRILGNCLTKDVYMDALEYEFRRAGLHVRREVELAVYYEDDAGARVRLAHQYPADFIVEDKILVVVKAEGNTADSNDYMLQNLLHAAGLHLALLMQFKEKKLRTKRVCRYTRYANSLNIKESEGLVLAEGLGIPEPEEYALKEGLVV
jgi:GxxExxY protein